MYNFIDRLLVLTCLNHFTIEARRKKRRESILELKKQEMKEQESSSLLNPQADEILLQQQMLWQFEPIQQQPYGGSAESHSDNRLLRDHSNQSLQRDPPALCVTCLDFSKVYQYCTEAPR